MCDLKKCIKCTATSIDSESTFCWNCGYPLDSNFCTNDYCAYNNGQQIPLEEYAVYCDGCGSETAYKIEGIVKTTDFPEKVSHRSSSNT